MKRDCEECAALRSEYDTARTKAGELGLLLARISQHESTAHPPKPRVPRTVRRPRA